MIYAEKVKEEELKHCKNNRNNTEITFVNGYASRPMFKIDREPLDQDVQDSNKL